MSLTVIVLLPLLTKVVILDRETSAADIIKVFASNIPDFRSEAAANTSGSEGGDELGEGDYTTNKTKDRKAAARQDTDSTTVDCANVLDFLQSIAMKSIRVEAIPLSLQVDKNVKD